MPVSGPLPPVFSGRRYNAFCRRGGVFAGTTYYVSPNGNDNNTGTSPGNAWQTLTKVNAATLPKPCRVLFEGGATFSGQLTLDAAKHYGTAGNTVTFGSYGTGRARILASGNGDDGLYALNPQYLTIQDLIFEGTGNTASTATGIRLENNQAGSTKLAGVTVYNCQVSKYGKNGISAWGVASDPSGFTGLLIEDCVVFDCTGNTVQDHGCGITIQGKYGLNLVAASHTSCTIRRCMVYDCTGKTGLTKHSGNGILVAQVDGCTIEYCEAYNNGVNGRAPVGIWAFDANAVTIQFCESHHNKTAHTTDGGGFDLDGGCTNCIIQYCYAHDNQGSGFQLYQYDGVWETVFYIKPLSGNHIRYNIAENNAQANPGNCGGILIGCDENVNQPNNYIYNNTIYHVVASSAAIRIPNNDNCDKIINSVIANNVFYVGGASSRFIGSAGNYALAGSMDIVGNLYYTTGSVSFKWGGNTYTSISAWRTATSKETLNGNDTSVSGNPLLVGTVPVGDIGGFNADDLVAYNTQSGSPARGAGRDLETLYSIDTGTRDLFGESLPQAAFNIGCSEATEAMA